MKIRKVVLNVIICLGIFAIDGTQNLVIAQRELPIRIYDSSQKRFIEYEKLIPSLASSDIVFLGEQHDSLPTHRIELAILESLTWRRTSVFLALEMFERDTQMIIDQYISGTIQEEEFIAKSRPWDNYATDYRPLVEFFKMMNLQPILASNLPRYLASAISQKGITILDTIDPDKRKLAATEINCPRDAYFRRFSEAMLSMGHPLPDTQILNMYQAQCAKDETMAESLAKEYSAGKLIVHINGAFHSDFKLGIVPRVQKRLKNVRIRTVSIIPVQNFDELRPSNDDLKRADYLIYVLPS